MAALVGLKDEGIPPIYSADGQRTGTEQQPSMALASGSTSNLTTDECALRIKHPPLKFQGKPVKTLGLGNRSRNQYTYPNNTASLVAEKSLDRGRASVLPDLANPSQGPRHRLLIGATLPGTVPSLHESPSTLAAATIKSAPLSTSSGVSSLVSSCASAEYTHSDTGTSKDAPSAGSLLPWSNVFVGEVCSESSMPENRYSASPMDHIETQPVCTSKSSIAMSRGGSQVELPDTTNHSRPLMSSAVDFNASGTCKVWRLTPVAVRIYFTTINFYP